MIMHNQIVKDEHRTYIASNKELVQGELPKDDEPFQYTRMYLVTKRNDADILSEARLNQQILVFTL